MWLSEADLVKTCGAGFDPARRFAIGACGGWKTAAQVGNLPHLKCRRVRILLLSQKALLRPWGVAVITIKIDVGAAISNSRLAAGLHMACRGPEPNLRARYRADRVSVLRSVPRPGEAGPFPLLTYSDVKKHARQIAEVTGTRFMPPWLPDPGHGDFVDERRLTDVQIRTIAEWVKQGAPEGPESEIPSEPKFTEGWQLGPPDLVLEAQRPFSVPASGPDVFWNFIFHPSLDHTRYVRAIEIRPGDKRLVHHANLVIDRAGWMRAREKTPGAGFAGMDLTVERTVFDFASHFLFWKPGSAPWVELDGFAWRLDPGSDLILNAHMRPSGKPEEVRPSIGLYFTDKPPTHFPMLLQLEHDGAINIPAGARDFTVTDELRLPLDVDVLAVYPHAHYLGTLLEGFATLPDGQRKWLIRIAHWDLNWQAVYHYREPVFLPKGTVISMRWHYDNSSENARNPNHPPKRVRTGDQASDEMGHLWLQVLPRGPNDRRRELEQALMQRRLEKYPDDFLARLNLGVILLSRANPAGAAAMLEDAVRVGPNEPEAHNFLGSALLTLGRSREAIDQFRLALKLRPDYPNAQYNLAKALVRSGRVEEAIQHFQHVAAELPEDAQLRNDLGEALVRANRLAEALEQFDAALKLDPTSQRAQENRQLVVERMRQP